MHIVLPWISHQFFQLFSPLAILRPRGSLIHSKYAGRIVSEVALPILCKINFKRHFKSKTIEKIIKFLLKSNYEFILYALLVDERNVKRYYTNKTWFKKLSKISFNKSKKNWIKKWHIHLQVEIFLKSRVVCKYIYSIFFFISISFLIGPF